MFEPTDKYLPEIHWALTGSAIITMGKVRTVRRESIVGGTLGSLLISMIWINGIRRFLFDRLNDFVELARENDIIVEIPFFNGMYNDCWPLMAMYHENNIQNIGQYEGKDCGLFTSTDIRNQDVINYQKAYIEKITAELNEFNNLIYDICDEPSLQGLPGGSVLFLPDSQVKPWINEMKEAFLQAEESLPQKTLLGQTVQNLSPDCSNESWCKWLPTEYVKPAEKALNLNYENNKPLINVESASIMASALQKIPTMLMLSVWKDGGSC